MKSPLGTSMELRMMYENSPWATCGTPQIYLRIFHPRNQSNAGVREGALVWTPPPWSLGQYCAERLRSPWLQWLSHCSDLTSEVPKRLHTHSTYSNHYGILRNSNSALSLCSWTEECSACKISQFCSFCKLMKMIFNCRSPDCCMHCLLVTAAVHSSVCLHANWVTLPLRTMLLWLKVSFLLENSMSAVLYQGEWQQCGKVSATLPVMRICLN